MTNDSPLLQARGLTKNFPGVRALSAVDFTLRRGEIHALMGENGAGKSTLIKVLTGVYGADGGEILLEGRALLPRSPQDAQRMGISTVYQEVNLVPFLSVAENISLGREPRTMGMIRWGEVRRRASAALARLAVDIDLARPVGSYPVAIQQLVAIARAVDVEARVLILDEPTSSLSAAEAERLFDVMRRLKAEGLGIVFVTHFLDQVYAVADRITVLRNGGLVGEYETATLGRLKLIAAMIGRDVSAVKELVSRHAAPSRAVAESDPLLEAVGVGRAGAVEYVDFAMRAGEVVGLAGLLGSGRTETARLLFGIDRPDRGEIRIDGTPVRLRTPRRAVRLGLGFAPEERKTEGIIPELSVRENIVLSLQAKRGWWRRIAPRRQREMAERYIKALGIRTPDAEKPISQLSGGNQQKAILARWLAAEPRLLILDEPTRGIDVGAKAEIERLIGELCGRGMSILLISSELDELVRNCARIMVLRDRRQVGELAGSAISEHAIMQTIAAEPASGPDALAAMPGREA